MDLFEDWDDIVEPGDIELASDSLQEEGFVLKNCLKENVCSGPRNLDPNEMEFLLDKLCFIKVSTKFCLHLV